jgi:uncharacterized membrane protein YkvA (DUF1232 family)
MTNDIKKPGYFRELSADFGVFGSMLRDYFKKRYPNLPAWTLFGIVVALLYIINPLDIVPEAIPFFGVIDDAAVAALELVMIRKDLQKYRQWLDGARPEDKTKQNQRQQ